MTDSIKGQTALILAASLGDAESMRHLLDYCADPNCQDVFGHTPLHHGKKKQGDIRMYKTINGEKKE